MKMEVFVKRRIAAVARHIAATPVASVNAQVDEASQRILSGLKVLELSTVVAAPAACAILADLGADVLKIENPEAPDYVRFWRFQDDPTKTADPDRLKSHQVGTGFTQFNRGKRAIALDYQKPEGLKILKQLLSESDVLVTNVRRKGLVKMGLDYGSLASEFPHLIYGHLSAWGLEGPREHDPGYDLGAFMAYTGLIDQMRSSDTAALPRMPFAFGDLCTAPQLVGGIALALYHRQRTGKGQLVDASLMRAGIWGMSHLITAHTAGNKFAAGAKPFCRGTTEVGERETMVTDASFKCKDGRWIMLLGVESIRHWTKTLQTLGLGDKLDPSWKTAKKSTDWKAATKLADEVFATKTYAEWSEILTAADVWYTPINSYGDLMTDVHANEAQAFAAVPGLSHKLVRSPIILSSQAGKDGPTGGAPGFGEHTHEVLVKLGYTNDKIRQLIDAKIVK